MFRAVKPGVAKLDRIGTGFRKGVCESAVKKQAHAVVAGSDFAPAFVADDDERIERFAESAADRFERNRLTGGNGDRIEVAIGFSADAGDRCGQ